MTDKEYLKKMFAFARELERSADAEPFDQGDFHNIVESIQLVNRLWLRSRRRRPWYMIFLLCLLLLLLAWILYCVLIENPEPLEIVETWRY